jgi:alpha-galactosidase
MNFKCSLFALAAFALVSCNKPIVVHHGKLLFEINELLETKVNSSDPAIKPLMDDFVSSEYLSCSKFDAKSFKRKSIVESDISDLHGKGKRLVISGVFTNEEYNIEKNLECITYDSIPDRLFLKIHYVNTGTRSIKVSKWVNHAYPILSVGDSPAFWSFQGSSSNGRKDWLLPVDSSFSQKNYMGMNNTDYGGGIPMIDLWRRDAGISIGHSEMVAKLVSFPVEKDLYDKFARIQVEYSYPQPLVFNVGDTLNTFTTFVSVHTGDCFESLESYSKFMQSSGIKILPAEPAAYEAVWCAWGYMQRFTVDEIVGTLQKVKDLGIKWVDIDDGYQQTLGDWDVTTSKFPNGGADMRKLVDRIHAMGLKAKIWWAPLALTPGSKLYAEQPDIILHTIDGAPEYITGWNSYYMSPVYSKTIDHTKNVLKMFFQDWNFDGLKMDGMHLNCLLPDYNPEHHLDYPEQSVEKLPEFYKMIYETSRHYKENAVLQICPCGCAMNYFIMPWTNQVVASDPTSSWQTRHKGKTYKALLGKTAYYGDHVELSDGADDFASQIGIGAVLGTKFTWPKDNPYADIGPFVLTPEKEKHWKHWVSVYNQKMLSRENYLGKLYDICYDKPETHVIQKADTLFYAFYTPDWNGEVELRGLKNGKFRVYDYINEKDLGTVNSENPKLKVSFKKDLLIEVYPE